ncbi:MULTISPECIES: DnaJ family domain-containing protein [Neobacillus]|jgi:hypothetical protein|uniref:DUF1992 domain-containing protein n=1 Tax=Neobacillus sedimentimangrovi TaxID=2699460 RepID=A0ABS8QLR8_9BACI|nr:DnaJ family domain-containing protein [Neobacillus sedimentimangrovi]AIM17163.1 hypothetical protein HW35_13665 [Bacillus sp. X1(2014)]MCD4840259.1 DUF1992 domain-containing protein [Neobacillus sedimentimangrovi]
MDLFHIIAEERIRKAYKDGEFDNLKGYGKPLELEDLSSIPEELRMAYKIMKNAGYTEEESSLHKEMMTIENLLKNCDDRVEKAELQKKLNEKLLRLNQIMSKRGVQTHSALFKNYEHKIEKRFK